MNIEYLQEFAELAKRNNITETAQAMNMLQPTLSKHISALEKELGITLFHRGSRAVSLTPEGVALLSHAYDAIDSIAALKRRAQELRKNPLPHFTVCGLTDEAPSTEVLGFLLSVLGDEFGTDAIEIKGLNHMEPVDILLEGHADIVFDPIPIQETNPDAGLASIHIGDLPLVMLMSAEHPLAQHSSLPLDALKDHEILQCEGIYTSRSWRYVEQACMANGFVPRTRSHHCSNTADLIALCTNLGMSILIIGKNFADRIPTGIAPYCKKVQIESPGAFVPFFLTYQSSNKNPMLLRLLEQIRDAEDPLIQF